MDLTILSALVSVILATSMASERIVTILKTIAPTWLADEKKTPAQEIDLTADKARRLRVQGIAVLASWLVAAAMVGDKLNLDALLGSVVIGPVATGLRIPAFLLGILASGGSALWGSVLGVTKALKDAKEVDKASRALAFHSQAADAGVVAVDGGQTVASRQAAIRRRSQAAILVSGAAIQQPSFDAGQARRIVGGGK